MQLSRFRRYVSLSADIQDAAYALKQRKICRNLERIKAAGNHVATGDCRPWG